MTAKAESHSFSIHKVGRSDKVFQVLGLSISNTAYHTAKNQKLLKT